MDKPMIRYAFELRTMHEKTPQRRTVLQQVRRVVACCSTVLRFGSAYLVTVGTELKGRPACRSSFNS